MMLMGERFGASQLQIGGGAGMAASQGQESVGQGGGSMPSVPAREGMGAGSVAEPLVVGPVMETSGAGMGGGSTVVQAQVGGQGGGSVPGAATSGGAMVETATGTGGGSVPDTTSDAKTRSGSSALSPRSADAGSRSRKRLPSG
jgi:hypothetical protein